MGFLRRSMGRGSCSSLRARPRCGRKADRFAAAGGPTYRRDRNQGKDIGGIAVHAAASVMTQAGSNEVTVSRVVMDLVAGAGLSFTERGS